MGLLSNTSRTEKTVLGVSVLLMLLALFLFVNERWYSRFLGNGELESQFTALGYIGQSQNDVRYKEGHSFDWRRSNADQNVYIGDSVFVGKNSQADVKLNGKNDLHLGENSLVKFSNFNGKTLSDLLAGNFRLQIDGEVQIAINGQVTTLKGDGSEVEVFFDKKNQPKMKLLKGAVTVSKEPPAKKVAKARKKMVEPDYTTVKKKETVLAIRNEEHILTGPEPEETYHLPPEPTASSKLVQYGYKIRDIYEQIQANWRLRKVRPFKADLQQTFAWTDGGQGPYQIASSSAENFDPQKTNLLTTTEKTLTVSNVYFGDNYWRVSRDGKEWSKTSHFVVVPEFRGTPPAFASREMHFDLVDGKTYGGKIEWFAQPDQTGFIVEGSAFENFPVDSTQVYWRREPNFPSGFKSAGTYYFRLRGANSQQEVTEYSNILKVVVTEPALLSQPQLPLAQLKFTKGGDNRVSWKGPAGTQSYTVRILNKNGSVVRESNLAQSQLPVSDLPVGEFNYQVVANDRFGRASEPSRAKNFSIENPVPKRVLASNPPPATPTPVAEPAEREPLPTPSRSAESVAKLRLEPSAPEVLPYSRSLVQIEGASLGVISSEQLTYGMAAPLLGTIGLRGQLWKDRLGAEASLKMKAFGYNPEAERVAPTTLEARVHRRWTLPWHWFSFLREIQASLFGGAEVYRNSKGGEIYSAGYELMKGGVALKFPLGNRYESGGELAYGLGLDTSHKYEASGYVSYLFKPQWSLGVGYRVHYFEAGSMKSTPYLLPYREAQGEAFSVLRYSY